MPDAHPRERHFLTRYGRSTLKASQASRSRR
jgi:hypothetical protein